MDENYLEAVEAYATLEDSEIYSDLESIISNVVDAKAGKHSFTSSQLPEGFESETFNDGDFGFSAEKAYDKGFIEVEYSEPSSISFGKADSSRIKVSVEPSDYTFREVWDQAR